jgi:hypothetical protein
MLFSNQFVLYRVMHTENMVRNEGFNGAKEITQALFGKLI